VICKRCVVSGRVQGVYYRGSTARIAASLGVTGHAVNLSDGRVEVLACGTAEAVDRLVAWLREGPSGAQVTKLDIEVLSSPEGKAPTGFTTG